MGVALLDDERQPFVKLKDLSPAKTREKEKREEKRERKEKRKKRGGKKKQQAKDERIRRSAREAAHASSGQVALA